MRINHFLCMLMLGLLLSCSGEEEGQTEGQTEATTRHAKGDQVSAMPDTTPRVTGIGGIFFKSEDPKAIKEWYGKNLGLAVDDFGSPFEFRNAHRPDEVNYLNWDAFVDSTDYFEPSQKQFMINYRVQNLEALVRQLKQNGVTITDSIVTYPYGKFVHIMDPEGNKLELWEPVDSVLSTMGRETTK